MNSKNNNESPKPDEIEHPHWSWKKVVAIVTTASIIMGGLITGLVQLIPKDLNAAPAKPSAIIQYIDKDTFDRHIDREERFQENINKKVDKIIFLLMEQNK
jgi:hypothetical protein